MWRPKLQSETARVLSLLGVGDGALGLRASAGS